jgi:hypothetical protein
MLRFILLVILFAVLVRMVARFIVYRFVTKHMGRPPSESRFDRIRDAEYEDVTDDK